MLSTAVNDTTHTMRRLGFARSETVASFRDGLRGWLATRVDAGGERVHDIVLAVNEALSNVADHAYPDGDATGLVEMTVTHDVAAAVIHVSVADRGRWRPPAVTCATSFRGRGLRLIAALADSSRVDSGITGTRVLLAFECCPMTRVPGLVDRQRTLKFVVDSEQVGQIKHLDCSAVTDPGDDREPSPLAKLLAPGPTW